MRDEWAKYNKALFSMHWCYSKPLYDPVPVPRFGYIRSHVNRKSGATSIKRSSHWYSYTHLKGREHKAVKSEKEPQ